jgi:flagellar biosynthesis protein FliR
LVVHFNFPSREDRESPVPEFWPNAFPAADGATLRAAFGVLNQSLVVFVLVATRLTGLFLTAPLFGHPEIPTQIRVFTVLAISLVLAPAVLTVDNSRAAARLDVDSNGLLANDEIPPELSSVFTSLREQLRLAADAPIPVSQVTWGISVPSTPLAFVGQAAGEMLIGFALGLGVMIWVSSMQFAGHMIDQQTGVSLGEIFNPELGSSSTLSGELLHWLGMTAFLSAGGHLLVMRTLIDSYQGIPLGHAWVPQPLFDLLGALVTQSLLLTLQIAAPVGISMLSVGLAMGFMGHAVPQLNVLVIGFPVRTMAGFVILMLALSRMVEALLRPLPDILERFLAACGGG